MGFFYLGRFQKISKLLVKVFLFRPFSKFFRIEIIYLSSEITCIQRYAVNVLLSSEITCIQRFYFIYLCCGHIIIGDVTSLLMLFLLFCHVSTHFQLVLKPNLFPGLVSTDNMSTASIWLMHAVHAFIKMIFQIFYFVQHWDVLFYLFILFYAVDVLSLET